MRTWRVSAVPDLPFRVSLKAERVQEPLEAIITI